MENLGLLILSISGALIATTPADMTASENLPSNPGLPNPLVCADGSAVVDSGTWEKQRRPEIVELFEYYMYGEAPAAPDNLTFTVDRVDAEYFGGKATLKEVTIKFGPQGARQSTCYW